MSNYVFQCFKDEFHEFPSLCSNLVFHMNQAFHKFSVFIYNSEVDGDWFCAVWFLLFCFCCFSFGSCVECLLLLLLLAVMVVVGWLWIRLLLCVLLYLLVWGYVFSPLSPFSFWWLIAIFQPGFVWVMGKSGQNVCSFFLELFLSVCWFGRCLLFCGSLE